MGFLFFRQMGRYPLPFHMDHRKAPTTNVRLAFFLTSRSSRGNLPEITTGIFSVVWEVFRFLCPPHEGVPREVPPCHMHFQNLSKAEPTPGSPPVSSRISRTPQTVTLVNSTLSYLVSLHPALSHSLARILAPKLEKEANSASREPDFLEFRVARTLLTTLLDWLDLGTCCRLCL